MILGLDDGLYYGLDSVGAYIWDLLKDPISIEEIMRNIKKEYEDVPESFQDDLMSFFDEILKKGFIEVKE